MRLRGRFTVWFSLAALVTIAAATVATRELVSKSYRDAHADLRESARRQAERELRRIEEKVVRSVRAVATLDHHYVGAALLEIVKNAGQLSADYQKDLIKRGGPVMNGLGLDIMFLLNHLDTILVAPHHHPSQEETDSVSTARARALGGKPYYGRRAVIDGDKIGEILVVESVRLVKEASYRVTVVGGVRVDSEILIAIRQEGRVEARIVGDRGVVLASSTSDWDALGDDSPIRLVLKGPDDRPVATVEVAISDADLTELLHDVTLVAGGLGAAALVVTILLGLFVARRMTRDLDELVLGAQAAARGDLEHEVPVRRRDEIGEVAEAFNVMMLELNESKEALIMAERVAAWQEIARRLAHEIKNPLTPIQMSVETMRKVWKQKHPSFDEIFDEATQTVLEEAARLKRIVSEFSEFARMPKPEKRPCDINELVSHAVSLYQGTIEVVKRLDPELPTVEVDRDSLSQVLLNLLENARDAIGQRDDGGEAGRITVQTLTTRNGKAIAIMIEDNGPGIPSHVREKLFTPYYTTKHATGGTGLGLAIVHRIVSDHGGRITPANGPDGGARFIVELPTEGATSDDLAASLTGRWRG